ncbi:MAG: CerR family C-terminal domain-containing protein [Planctomycetaceae bacterium]
MPDDTRIRILNAAGPIFAEKGFESSTVREICEAAEVNVASVNYHFGDKSELYRQTVSHARELTLIQVPWPELGEDAGTRDQLFAFVTTMLNRLLGNESQPWQSRLMMREILSPTENCRSMVREFFQPRLETLIAILEPVFPAQLEEHKRQKFAFSVMGQCLFYRAAEGVFKLVVPEEQRSANFQIEQLANHITHVTLLSLGVTDPHCQTAISEAGAES